LLPADTEGSAGGLADAEPDIERRVGAMEEERASRQVGARMST
jgi:hypothetical protein